MPDTRIRATVAQYYEEKIKAHGATAQGVDWNSPESQALRFEQLLKVCDTSRPFSIIDYGCGYGALVDYMSKKGYSFQYRGLDISKEMISMASGLHKGSEFCEFFTDESRLATADYTVASGIFNVKLGISVGDWKVHVLDTIARLAALSRRGFAFNILTKYSDPQLRRPDLYYADPCFLFDYCKTHSSRRVALLHDYGLYEFTMVVRL